MFNKEKMHELVEHLPEEFSIDDVVERMILAEKIDLALNQLEKGKYLTSEELDEEIEKWD